MNIILRILALIRKELTAIFKDPRSRFVVLGPPILQMIIFGYAGTFDLNHVPYVLVDQSHSSESTRFIGRINGSGIFDCVASVGNIRHARPLLDSRRALLIIQIPQYFDRDIVTGRGAQVQVIADGRNSNTAALAIGFLNDIQNQFNADLSADDPGIAPPGLIRTYFRDGRLCRE
jgi:ABC-2 type transport system permease protein